MKNTFAELMKPTKGNQTRMIQLVVASLAMMATPAFAQIAKVNAVMTNIQTLLAGISVTVFSVAIIWAGFKMAFQHARWSEVVNIVIGGILVGGATGLASWLIN